VWAGLPDVTGVPKYCQYGWARVSSPSVTRSGQGFSTPAGWEGMVGEFFQGSLIVQNFENHRMQRSLMQTAIKAESLHGNIHSINNIVQASLKHWPKQEPMLFYPAVKRLPEYWHEPFKFDPMRFSESRAEHKQHKFLWAPFGGGGHKCIGLHFADMLFKSVLPKDNLPLILISEC
jgi:cytochrome P450